MNKPVPQKIIIEGAELTGKSFVTSQLYNILEPELNSKQANLLDGCHWFNCDVGIFGTDYGKEVIQHYLKIATVIKNSHLIFEKFHLADQVYNQLYNQKKINYAGVEKKLSKLGFKLVFLHLDESIELIKTRLQDRLKLYPHYERISQSPEMYLVQQKAYRDFFAQSRLEKISVNTTDIKNQKIIEQIIKWVKQN